MHARIVTGLMLGLALSLSPLMTESAQAQENPKVAMETSMGEIVVELFREDAPVSVQNFLEYVDEGFYDGTIFHRVINGFVVQGGGFRENGRRKDNDRDAIENEADNGISNIRGTLALARTSDPHSATSQFFINLVDNSGSLDHKGKNRPEEWGYAVFGLVVEGLDVVDRIAGVETGRGDKPVENVVLTKAYRVE